MKHSLSYLLVLFIFSTIPAIANDQKIKRFKSSFDKNSDGVVTKDEYVSTRSKWGKTIDESEKYFKYHDKNSDGSLTLDEFLTSK